MLYIIHPSLPNSFKGLVSRQQSFEIGTRCNLEMSHAYLALWVLPWFPSGVE
jgi:hypothetical protein